MSKKKKKKSQRSQNIKLKEVLPEDDLSFTDVFYIWKR